MTALTLNAAKHLGLSDEIGTLEVGKVADLLVVKGDPLSDIGVLANVAVVVVEGSVVVEDLQTYGS